MCLAARVAGALHVLRVPRARQRDQWARIGSGGDDKGNEPVCIRVGAPQAANGWPKVHLGAEQSRAEAKGGGGGAVCWAPVRLRRGGEYSLVVSGLRKLTTGWRPRRHNNETLEAGGPHLAARQATGGALRGLRRAVEREVKRRRRERVWLLSKADKSRELTC